MIQEQRGEEQQALGKNDQVTQATAGLDKVVRLL